MTACVIPVFAANRTLIVPVAPQPINMKYVRDADARDPGTRRVTGTTFSVQSMCCEQALALATCGLSVSWRSAAVPVRSSGR